MSLRALWLVFAVAAAAAYGWVVLGVGPRLMAAGGGLPPFDLRPGGYDVAAAAAYLDRIGDAGRAWYAHRVIPADLAFAALFTAALGLGARLLSARWLVVPAALPGLIDLAENLALRALLTAPPGPPDPALVARASALTQAKWVALAVSAAVLAGLALRRRRGRRG
jgi:hypothetical protein